jgi:hypothetical protein
MRELCRPPPPRPICSHRRRAAVDPMRECRHIEEIMEVLIVIYAEITNRFAGATTYSMQQSQNRSVCDVVWCVRSDVFDNS